MMAKLHRRNHKKVEAQAETPIVETTPAPASTVVETKEIPNGEVAAVETPVVKKKAKRYASKAVLANSNARIVRLTLPNPRKEGTLSFQKYAMFEVGLSIAEIEAKFVKNNWAKGKARNQLRWDIEHGYVELEVPAEPKAAE